MGGCGEVGQGFFEFAHVSEVGIDVLKEVAVQGLVGEEGVREADQGFKVLVAGVLGGFGELVVEALVCAEACSEDDGD